MKAQQPAEPLRPGWAEQHGQELIGADISNSGHRVRHLPRNKVSYAESMARGRKAGSEANRLAAKLKAAEKGAR